MKKKMKWIPAILATFCCLHATTQAQEVFIDPSAQVFTFTKSPHKYECDRFNIDSTRDTDPTSLGTGEGVYYFGKVMPVSLNTTNCGTWETVGGYDVWRVKIISHHAFSLSLSFDTLKLPPNTSLFIYDTLMNVVAGPFNDYYNGLPLSTQYFPGESLIIELTGVGLASIGSTRSYLNILDVAHDYRGVMGGLITRDEISHETDWEDSSPLVYGCHEDVTCPSGDIWQEHKRGVMKIYLKMNGYSGSSSGCLINTTDRDGQPYIYTAQHAVRNQEQAAKCVFVFNYDRQCGQGDGVQNNIMSGANLVATYPGTDMSLLKLWDRIPSTYRPFFAGWDRGNAAPQSGTIISHPKGNPKKIAFEFDPYAPNPSQISFGDQYSGYIVIEPNGAWMTYLDQNTTEGGSSGGPLFDENQRIIGNLSGGESGCPGVSGIRKIFGSFASSWTSGNNNGARLKPWLDPTNLNPTTLSGFSSEGWLHSWLEGWWSPSSHNVHMNKKSIAAGSGGQIFYRGSDNKVQVQYMSNGNWIHGWLIGTNIPNDEKVGGDIVVGEGNQVFYRGVDGKLQCIYYGNGAWHHVYIQPVNSSVWYDVNALPGSLTIGSGNQLFYRGYDNKIHVYYYSNGNWIHGYIDWNQTGTELIAGDVVCSNNNNINTVYYRGADGRMQMYSFSFATNTWGHDWVDNAYTPSTQNVSTEFGAITTGGDKVYYRGVDNKIHMFAPNLGIMTHYTLGNHGMTGGLTANDNDQVFFRGTDAKMHVYYRNGATWVHDWIENSWQAPDVHNVSGPIDMSAEGGVCYRGFDGKLMVYYFAQSFSMKPSQDSVNYGMESTSVSQTIPLDRLNDNLFEINPNPVIDVCLVNYRTENAGKGLVSITDISGKEVVNYKEFWVVGQNQIKVDMKSLTAGVYLFTVINSNGVKQTKKVVKQ